jgi:hypothetical protein
MRCLTAQEGKSRWWVDLTVNLFFLHESCMQEEEDDKEFENNMCPRVFQPPGPTAKYHPSGRHPEDVCHLTRRVPDTLSSVTESKRTWFPTMCILQGQPERTRPTNISEVRPGHFKPKK